MTRRRLTASPPRELAIASSLSPCRELAGSELDICIKFVIDIEPSAPSMRTWIANVHPVHVRMLSFCRSYSRFLSLHCWAAMLLDAAARSAIGYW